MDVENSTVVLLNLHPRDQTNEYDIFQLIPDTDFEMSLFISQNIVLMRFIVLTGSHTSGLKILTPACPLPLASIIETGRNGQRYAVNFAEGTIATMPVIFDDWEWV